MEKSGYGLVYSVLWWGQDRPAGAWQSGEASWGRCSWPSMEAASQTMDGQRAGTCLEPGLQWAHWAHLPGQMVAVASGLPSAGVGRGPVLIEP